MCWEEAGCWTSLPASLFLKNNFFPFFIRCFIGWWFYLFYFLSKLFVFAAQWASDEWVSPLNKQMLINNKNMLRMLELLSLRKSTFMSKVEVLVAQQREQERGKKKSYSSPAAGWVMSKHTRSSFCHSPNKQKHQMVLLAQSICFSSSIKCFLFYFESFILNQWSVFFWGCEK